MSWSKIVVSLCSHAWTTCLDDSQDSVGPLGQFPTHCWATSTIPKMSLGHLDNSQDIVRVTLRMSSCVEIGVPWFAIESGFVQWPPVILPYHRIRLLDTHTYNGITVKLYVLHDEVCQVVRAIG